VLGFTSKQEGIGDAKRELTNPLPTTAAW